MKQLPLLFILCTVLSFSCVQKSNKVTGTSFVHTDHQQLIDSAGNPVILRGINLMDKTSEGGYFVGVNQAAFDSIASWGMNAVRLGIFWSAIEPQPGIIDTAYLRKLDQRIEMAEKAGVYVLLDMHQDLYSEKYNGDGAPEWACLDGGQPNITEGSSWDDAYFSSPAIQTAFDHFWDNKKAEDSIGLQDHYAHAWSVIAERYKDNPTVLGYDIMNEPFIGSPIKQVMQQYFKVLLDTLKSKKGSPIQNGKQLMALWMSEKGRAKIMGMLSDIPLFKSVMDATEGIYAKYEKTQLQPFYDRVFEAIHKVDTSHLLFLEPSVSANIGVKSHLQNKYGKYMVYAPHTYDIVTDTKHQASFSKGRLQLILDRHAHTQQRLDVPMVMGEWGAFYQADSSVVPQAAFIMHEMDSLKCGHFYWAFQKDLRKRSYFPVLNQQE